MPGRWNAHRPAAVQLELTMLIEREQILSKDTGRGKVFGFAWAHCSAQQLSPVVSGWAVDAGGTGFEVSETGYATQPLSRWRSEISLPLN
jgi:hypothetical protein